MSLKVYRLRLYACWSLDGTELDQSLWDKIMGPLGGGVFRLTERSWSQGRRQDLRPHEMVVGRRKRLPNLDRRRYWGEEVGKKWVRLARDRRQDRRRYL